MPKGAKNQNWFARNWKGISYWLVACAAWGGLVGEGVLALSLPSQAVAFIGGLGASAAVASGLVAIGIVVLPALIIYAGLTAWYNSIEESDQERMKAVIDVGRLVCVLVPMAAVIVIASTPILWPLLLAMAAAPFSFMLLRAIPAVIGWALHVEDPAKDLCDAARRGDNEKVIQLTHRDSYAGISDERKLQACCLAIQNRRYAAGSQNHAGVVVSLLDFGDVSVDAISDGYPLLIVFISHCQYFSEDEIDAIFGVLEQKGVNLDATTSGEYNLTALDYVNSWDESPLRVKMMTLLDKSRSVSLAPEFSVGPQAGSGVNVAPNDEPLNDATDAVDVVDDAANDGPEEDGATLPPPVEEQAELAPPPPRELPAISDPAKDYIVAIYVDQHREKSAACVNALREQCTPAQLTSALGCLVTSPRGNVRLDQVQILLSAGAGVDTATIYIDGSFGQQWTVWSYVKQMGKCSDEIKDLINARHHQNALEQAVLCADAGVIVEAVQAGATLELIDSAAKTIALLRVLSNQRANPHYRSKAVDLLLPQAEVGVCMMDEPRDLVSGRDDPIRGDTVLHLLVRCRYHYRISDRSGFTGDHLELTNGDDETPLHLAFKLRNYECVKALLAMGADLAAVPVELKNEALYDVLLDQYSKDRFELAKQLLAAGADVNARVPQLPPLLHCGTNKGDSALLDFLIERDANRDLINVNGKTALAVALDKRPFPRVVLILCQKDVAYLREHSDQAQRTAALLRLFDDPGVYDQHLFETFCLFLVAGVDIKAVDRDGNTLLHLVSRFCTDVTCQFDFIQPLLALKPEALRENKAGQTPLMYARQSRHNSQLQPLIAYVEDAKAVMYLEDLKKEKPERFQCVELEEFSDKNWARIVLTAVQNKHPMAEQLLTQHFNCLQLLDPADYAVVYEAHKNRIDEMKARREAEAPSVGDHGVFGASGPADPAATKKQEPK